jgi:hypothetical protein
MLRSSAPTIDLADHSYMQLLKADRDPVELLVGGPNRRWKQWKRMLPDRPEIWNELLRRRWMDRKLDPDFDYPQAPPPDPVTAAKLLIPEREMWDLGCLEFEDDPESPGSILREFTVDKADTVCPVTGGLKQRVVVDGKVVSTNEDIPHYKGPTVAGQIKWVPKNARLLRTDLSKMYWQVEARTAQRRYQRVWSVIYKRLARLTCAGMGWKGVPRWAQMMMSATARWMFVNLGLNVYTYMDEGLAAGEDEVEAYMAARSHREILAFQGWQINFDKSDTFVPRRSTDFCGITHHTTFGTVSPPLTRMAKVRTTSLAVINLYHGNQNVSGWLLASLLGQLNSLLPLHQQAGFRQSRMSAVRAQFQRRHGPTRMALRRHHVPRQALAWIIEELTYWASSNPGDEWRYQPKLTEMWDSVMTVDSSMWGYAAEANAFYTQGHFDAQDRQRHHCTLEFLGGSLGRQAFYNSPAYTPGSSLKPHDQLVQYDNVTSVTAAEKFRTKNMEMALLASAQTKIDHQEMRRVHARHLGKLLMDSEYRVDKGGRCRSNIWGRMLPPHAMSHILNTFGLQTMPMVDLFATSVARQSPRYVSHFPDHQSLWSDAFSQEWNPSSNHQLRSSDLLFAFPPENQVSRVLHHYEASATSNLLLLVVPCWSRSWLMDLCRLSICQPLIFSGGTSLLLPPEGTQIALDLPKSTWCWTACVLSKPACPSSLVTRVKQSRRCSLAAGRRDQKAPTTTLLGLDGLSSSTALDLDAVFSRVHSWPTFSLM